jgi:hypothetical protein
LGLETNGRELGFGELLYTGVTSGTNVDAVCSGYIRLNLLITTSTDVGYARLRPENLVLEGEDRLLNALSRLPVSRTIASNRAELRAGGLLT